MISSRNEWNSRLGSRILDERRVGSFQFSRLETEEILQRSKGDLSFARSDSVYVIGGGGALRDVCVY